MLRRIKANQAPEKQAIVFCLFVLFTVVLLMSRWVFQVVDRFGFVSAVLAFVVKKWEKHETNRGAVFDLDTGTGTGTFLIKSSFERGFYCEPKSTRSRGRRASRAKEASRSQNDVPRCPSCFGTRR